MTKPKLIFALMAAIIAGIFLSPQSQAQEEKEGIGISPTTLTLQADPGQELKGQITVLNEGDQPIKYKVYANNFSIRNEDYDKDFDSTPSSLSPSDWFSLPQGTLELEPKSQAKLDYSITVPNDAISQGYYGVIFAETVANDPDSTGVVRVKRVGSLVYLGVTGGLVEEGHIVEFKAASWQQSSPIKAQLRLQNDGNVHLEAKGQLELKNILGKTVGSSAIQGTVIPGTIRKLNLELDSPGFGIYKIEGKVSFNNQDTTLTQWVFVASQFWLTILGLAIISGVVLLAMWIKRHARRKK